MPSRLSIRVARVVLPLVGLHHGILRRVDTIGDDQSGSEERSVRPENGRREPLEGSDTEPRHFEYVFGGVEKRIRFR